MIDFTRYPAHVVIACDPGVSGAFAFLGSDICHVEDTPIMAKGRKNQVNAAGVADLLRPFAGGYVVLYLEQVGPMPKQGVTSTFNFGESYGVVRGVVAALGIPMELVTPQAWKKAYRLTGKDKDAARTKAIELFPSAPLARKKDVGRADALLIAKYGLDIETRRVAWPTLNPILTA